MNQGSLRSAKKDIVRELFVKTADQTYVVARWCLINRLYLDFYWNGLHAIEKYLKASLLLNGRSAISSTPTGTPYGHNIERLFASVRKYAADLVPKSLKKPRDLKIAYWRPETAVKFVERMNRWGDPSNRYNLFGFAQHPDDLYKFDMLIFALRRLCVELEADYFGQRAETPPFKSNATVLKENPAYQPVRIGSRLTYLTGKNATDAVKEAALHHNLPFAPPGYDHGSLPAHSSASNPVLHRRIIVYAEQGTQNASDRDEILALADWVIGNIFLPGDAKLELEKARQHLAMMHAG